MIVAPASAARVDGGIGVHTSSQISTPSVKSGTSRAANSRSVPNGAVQPATSISSPATKAPEDEVPAFVEFAIVRQVGLGDDAEQPAAMDDQRAIVSPAAPAQRRAGDDDGHEVRAGGDQFARRRFDGVEQRRLVQQVVDGVGGQAEFRQDDDRRGFLVRRSRHFE